jgi:hypothetical protein
MGSMNSITAAPAKRRDSVFFQMLATTTVVLLLILFVEAAPAQAQMFLTGGMVPVSSAFLKLALIFPIGIATVAQFRETRNEFPAGIWLGLVAYLCADAAFLAAARHLQISDILLGYNAYYALLLVAPFAFTLRDTVRERVIVGTLLAAFVICSAIAAAQYATNLPLLFTESADGNFTIQSWSYYGSIRAFSLFDSGLGFGFFTSLMGAFAIARCGNRGGYKLGIPLLLFAALACYATLTRVVYLQFLCACCSAAVLTFSPRKRPYWGLPVLYLCAGLFVASVGTGTFSAHDLLANDSLVERHYEWQHYFSEFASSGLARQSFGSGLVQNERLRPGAFLIDNYALAVALHVGIVGLILLACLLWVIWRNASQRALEARSPLSIAVASIWDTFLLVAVFNIVPVMFYISYMFTMIASPAKRKCQNE